MNGRLHCSLCRVRVRRDHSGRETIRTVNGSVEHRHPNKPYRLELMDETPGKWDWYPGRTR
jgi:hypothetical protein